MEAESRYLVNFRQPLGSSRRLRVIVGARQLSWMVSGVTRDTYLITEKKSEQKILFHHEEKTFSKIYHFQQKVFF